MNFFWGVYSKPNFGDFLTTLILNFLKIKKFNMTNNIDISDAMMIGSIIRFARNDMKVFGSGIIDANDKINPNADYKFVRGPLTRKKILESGGKCPEIYGDAATILPLFCPEKIKKHKIGIVPHYVDYELINEKYKNEYKIINVINNNPLRVAEEISECEKIISSSLHGIIVAHSYGIPSSWAKSVNKLTGDDVKFKDYFSSINLEVKKASSYEKPIFFDYTHYNQKQLIDIVKDNV